MHIIARQTVWTGNQHSVDRALFDPVPQAVEPWSGERGTTIPIITEDMLWMQGLPLPIHVCGETVDLLFNGLGQGLSFGRHPDINRGAHASPLSVVCEMVRAQRTVLEVSSIEAGIGIPDPSAAPRPQVAGI